MRSFGAGLFVWPHGIFVDRTGNVWVADAVDTNCETGRENGKGHQVHKFSPAGELLMSLGAAGKAGEDERTFSCPSDVLVSPDGDIFVADGHNHGHGGNNRIVKFTRDGKFATAWGKGGDGPGEFSGIHALAMDSQGRIFVGDRANRRIQILNPNGNHLATWTQFGSPSGIYIDENDTIYVADSDSGFDPDSNGRPRNPGFERGIYIGDARTGKVEAFIPDPEARPRQGHQRSRRRRRLRETASWALRSAAPEACCNTVFPHREKARFSFGGDSWIPNPIESGLSPSPRRVYPKSCILPKRKGRSVSTQRSLSS